MARLALLCVVELVVVVALAVAVFASPGWSEGRPVDAGPAAGAPPTPEATLTANTSKPPSALPAAGESPYPPARTQVKETWRADDPVGVLLTGTLCLRDGKPAEASVTLSRAKVRTTASAAADGTFALVGLQPGEWTVTLRGTTVVEATETLIITDEAVQRHDFVLAASYAVAVRIVTPEGKDGTSALRKALPWWGDWFVAGQAERFPERLAPTDYGAVFAGDARWSGEMNPVNGAAGTLHVTSLPAHVALLHRHLVLQQKVVEPGQADVEFVVDVDALKRLAGSAMVRVLDAVTGEPLAKARVAMNTSNRGGMGLPVDADGRRVLEGLSPGLLHCEISAADHESMYATVRIEVSERLDLGEVRLGPMVPFQGTLLDAEGRPASTGNVTWADLKWRTQPTAFATNRHAGIDADGVFTLWNTGRGLLTVTARDQTGNVAVGVFDNPPPAPVVLRLAAPGECLVRRPVDATRAFTVTLFDAAQRPIAAHALDPRQTSLPIRLPFGAYTYEVDDDEGRSLQRGALTFSAAPCTLEIR